MKTLILKDVGKVDFEEHERPQAAGRDIVVKISGAGICGTDLASYRSGVAMGFGHEMAGVVCEVGDESPISVGTRVFVSNLSKNLVSYRSENRGAYIGGFAEYILIKNAELGEDVFEIPDTLDDEEAALVEPFCVGMSGAKKYPFSEDSHVVIYGAGIIGMCALMYMLSKGVKNPVVVDFNEIRLQRVKEAGAIPFSSAKGGLKDFLTEQFGTAVSATAGTVPNVDVYIDCVGAASIPQEVLGMAKVDSQLTVLGVHHKPVETDFMSIMYNRLRVMGSVMFKKEDIKEAIALLAEDKKICRTLITHKIPFSEAKKAFQVASDADASLKVIMVNK